jgi:glycosyltransferase involved in cell wall biosynthesis
VDKVNILIVQDTDWIRRNPIQHNHLAERMVLRGHEIRVIDYEILWRTEGRRELFTRRQVFHVSRIFKDANHIVIRPGILKIPVLDYVSMFFTYKREINRQIQEFKPDIILGDGVLTPYLAFKLARKNEIKTVYYCIDRDYKLIPFKFIQRVGKMIESKNMKTADFVLSINEGLREYTIRMGANPDKTLVIRAGIDTKRYNPKIDGEEIRNKYGIEKSDNVLFFMGWLYHFSGLKEVAIELSKLDDKNIKLLIVGDGDAFNELQMIREQYGLHDNVIMTGKQPYEDIPKFIASADICILPAYNNEIMKDIVPIKMYEYMAMSKPVITTELPGIMKEFGDGNGVIYVDKPEDGLKKAIELIENGSIEEEGRRARRFVEKLSWDNITDEFEGVLEAVTEDNVL